MKAKKVIFDIDGTLSDNTHRVHHVQKTPKDWTSFFAAQGLDTVRRDVVTVLHLYDDLFENIHVALLTGRGEEYRDSTEHWLAKHSIPYDSLTMRPKGDRTDDNVIKMDWIERWQREGWDIIGLYDDRKRICDAAREHGITVFQVAEGNF